MTQIGLMILQTQNWKEGKNALSCNVGNNATEGISNHTIPDGSTTHLVLDRRGLDETSSDAA